MTRNIGNLLLSRTLTLVAAAVGIILLALAIIFIDNSSSISLEASQSLLDLDGGLVILQWARLLFAVLQ